MTITVNGETKSFDAPMTIKALVDALAIKERVAVEVNGAIVPRAEHPTRVIADGDSLEIVYFVGGG